MNSVFLPILIPLIAMMLLIFVRPTRFGRAVMVAGSSLLLIAAIHLLVQVRSQGIISLYMGAWEAPFGISLVIDMFSALMLVVSAVIFLAISVYIPGFMPRKTSGNRFGVFFFALAMGVNGAFITGDIFNLYVWFELMLISSFVLITYCKQHEQYHAGIKYLGLNFLGSLFLLAGIGLLYGKTGSLNMAHIAAMFAQNGFPEGINLSASLIFLAFGIKAAIFPLFFWLPASYHKPNVTITALFAGILTKVGVYAMFRFFTLIYLQDGEAWHMVFMVIAGLTMLYGGFAASTQYKMRKILSFHIISQVGYMVMGLGIFTPLAIAGSIYFIMHNMIAKTNTFLVAGMIHKIKGSYDLKSIGGMLKENPFLAVLYIIPAFALAGIPPVSGFFAKFILIKAGFEAGEYMVTAVALFTGLLTLYSMIKIWNEAFLKADTQEKTEINHRGKLRIIDYFPSVLLGLISLLMGIFANTVFDYVQQAAEILMNPDLYIDEILQ